MPLRVLSGNVAPRKVPKPPMGMLKKTREYWAEFWESDLAQLTEPATDMMALVRLYRLFDERERADRACRKNRLVEGSHGQIVGNPLGRLIPQYDREIRHLEDRFGLSPKSRLMLGITFGQAGKTLEDLNKVLADEDDGDGDEIDPRLQGAEQFFTGPRAIGGRKRPFLGATAILGWKAPSTSQRWQPRPQSIPRAGTRNRQAPSRSPAQS